MDPTALDDLDRRLLALLRHDARAPAASLAAALGVARSTVAARIDRLRASGVIQGFTVTLARPSALAGVRAITLIDAKALDRTARRLGGFPEITALHSTNGRWDLIAEIETPSLDALDTLLSRIRLVEGVDATETHILLSTRRGTAQS